MTPLRDLIEVLIAQGENDAAQEVAVAVSRWRTSQPDSEPWLKLSDWASYIGELDAAVQLAGVALALEPFNIDILLKLSTLWDEQATGADKGRWGDYASAAANTYRQFALSQLEDSPASTRDRKRVVGALEGRACQRPSAEYARWRVERWIGGLQQLHAVLDNKNTDQVGWHFYVAFRCIIDGNYLGHVPFPETHFVWHAMGRLASELDRWALATKCFERARKTALPHDLATPVGWLVDLGYAYLAQGDVEIKKNANPTKRKQLLQNAGEAYTEVLKHIDESAIKLSGKRRSAKLKADVLFAEVRAEAFAGRADAALLDSDLVGAIQDSKQAIQLRPIYPYPYVTLARARSEKGEHKAAVAAWQHVIGLVIDETAPWRVHLANAYVRAAEEAGSDEEKGYLELAVDEYCKALLSGELDPHSEVETREELAHCLEKLGVVRRSLAERQRGVHFLERLADGNEAVRSYVNLAKAHIRYIKWATTDDRRAWILTAVNDCERAVELACDAYRRRRSDENRALLAWAENELAWLYATQAARLKDGLKRAAHATALARHNARNRRGTAGIERRRADKDLLAACLDTWGRLLQLTGDHVLARKHFEEALSLSVDDPWITRRQLVLTLEALAAEEKDEACRQRLLSDARQQWQLLEMDPEDRWVQEARQHLSSPPLSPPVVAPVNQGV